jgi:hypothetical protein
MVRFVSILNNQFMVFSESVIEENIYFNAKSDGVMKTSIRNEIDNFYFRTIKLFFSPAAMDLEVWIQKIRIDPISTKMLSKIISSTIMGDIFGNDEEVLIKYILKSKDPQFIFRFIEDLIRTERGINDENAKEIIHLCFSVCFRNIDFQKLLFDGVNNVLKTLCSTFPKYIGVVLEQTRGDFEVYQDVILEVIAGLPLDKWFPSPDEVYILESMLKDPLTSIKSTLSRYIIDQIPWEHSGSNQGSYISTECQKQLALTITNVQLDFSLRNESYLQQSGKMITTAIKYTTMQTSKDLGSEFNEWCWKIIKRLKIYSKPNSPNSYPLTINPTWTLRPFETIDCPALSTLRGQLKSSSLAAYTMLMLSELGHRFDLFNENGWELLILLLTQKQYLGFVNLAFEVFQTFSAQGEKVFETPELKMLFSVFWKTINDRDLDLVLELMSKLVKNNSYSIFAIRFFGQLGFGKHEWFKSSLNLKLINELCLLAVGFVNIKQLLVDMNSEYKTLMFSTQPVQGNQISVRSPVVFLYDKFFTPTVHEYPTLLTTINPLIRGDYF